VPADKTLLEVVRDAVPTMIYSCEEGYCGACEVKVLDGCVDHHDLILSDAEKARNTAIMICVSRATSPKLVLDL
jgi:ferredoxin